MPAAAADADDDNGAADEDGTTSAAVAVASATTRSPSLDVRGCNRSPRSRSSDDEAMHRDKSATQASRAAGVSACNTIHDPSTSNPNAVRKWPGTHSHRSATHKDVRNTQTQTRRDNSTPVIGAAIGDGGGDFPSNAELRAREWADGDSAPNGGCQHAAGKHGMENMRGRHPSWHAKLHVSQRVYVLDASESMIPEHMRHHWGSVTAADTRACAAREPSR